MTTKDRQRHSATGNDHMETRLNKFARIASLCEGFHLRTLHGYIFHQDFWPNLNFPLEQQIRTCLLSVFEELALKLNLDLYFICRSFIMFCRLRSVILVSFDIEDTRSSITFPFCLPGDFGRNAHRGNR